MPPLGVLVEQEHLFWIGSPNGFTSAVDPCAAVGFCGAAPWLAWVAGPGGAEPWVAGPGGDELASFAGSGSAAPSHVVGPYLAFGVVSQLLNQWTLMAGPQLPQQWFSVAEPWLLH